LTNGYPNKNNNNNKVKSKSLELRLRVKICPDKTDPHVKCPLNVAVQGCDALSLIDGSTALTQKKLRQSSWAVA
jgi:hypothetical protein